MNRPQWVVLLWEKTCRALRQAQAQSTPSLPLPHGHPPGGASDTLARVAGQKLSEMWGQPVVVENRAGAGGLVGTAHVARQPADGYTWLFTTASHVNTPRAARSVGRVPEVPLSTPPGRTTAAPRRSWTRPWAMRLFCHSWKA